MCLTAVGKVQGVNTTVGSYMFIVKPVAVWCPGMGCKPLLQSLARLPFTVRKVVNVYQLSG